MKDLKVTVWNSGEAKGTQVMTYHQPLGQKILKLKYLLLVFSECCETAIEVAIKVQFNKDLTQDHV